MKNILIFEKLNLLFLYFLFITLITLLTAFISLSSGIISIPLKDIYSILFSNNFNGEVNYSIIWDIRLPRIILSFFVGMALSISGAVMQGIFRNPLADPSILGVSAGAALGAVIPFSLAIQSINLFIVPSFSFLGGLIASFLVYMIFVFTGRKSNMILLLSGVAIGSFLNALITLSVYLSDNPFQMRSIFYWLIGGFESTRWEHLIITVPIIFFGTIFLFLKSKEVNMIMIGDDYAASLGINVNRFILLCLFFYNTCNICGCFSEWNLSICRLSCTSHNQANYW